MNSISKTAISLAALFGFQCFVPSVANSAEISFEQAWQLLQNKNNAIAAQHANVERYRQKEKATEALYLPSISIGANYTHFDDDISVSGEELYDSLDSSTQASLSALGLSSLLSEMSSTIANQDTFTSSIRAIWPIFTGGRITAAQTIAEGQTEEAVAQMKMETQAQYEDLAKYYFSVVLAKSVLQTRKTVEQGLVKHRDFSIKLEEQGQIAKVERLQSEASLDKARVDRRKAQKDVDIAISALTEILNQTDLVFPASNLFINGSLPDLQLFIDETLGTYPGLSIFDAKEKQATNLVKLEQGNYYPEVYAYGNYSLYEDDSLASEIAPDWMVGVGVSIPLIDRNGRSEKVAAAHSTVLQVRYLRQQAKQNLKVLVQQTYFEAEQAIQEVEGLDSSLELAEENLRLRSKAFNQGLSNSLEVIDAELYLASIKTQQQVAAFNYIIALNKLLALTSDMDSFHQYEQQAMHNFKVKDK